MMSRYVARHKFSVELDESCDAQRDAQSDDQLVEKFKDQFEIVSPSKDLNYVVCD